MSRILKIACLVLFPCLVSAQGTSSNEGALFNVSFHYGFYLPAADLKDRFGSNFYTGIGTEFILKNDLILGIEGGLIFGNRVKEDVLSSLRNASGEIVGIVDGVGVLGNISLRQRGLYGGLRVGKLFPISKINKRSSIRTTIGIGILQHKVRIQDDDASVPQLEGDFKKNYDRLANGLSLQQFIGYQILSPDRRSNFYFGFEFYQGFTQGRRSFDVNLKGPDEEKRFDFIAGIKAGWILPFYFNNSVKEEIFY